MPSALWVIARLHFRGSSNHDARDWSDYDDFECGGDLSYANPLENVSRTIEPLSITIHVRILFQQHPF